MAKCSNKQEIYHRPSSSTIHLKGITRKDAQSTAQDNLLSFMILGTKQSKSQNLPSKPQYDSLEGIFPPSRSDRKTDSNSPTCFTILQYTSKI